MVLMYMMENWCYKGYPARDALQMENSPLLHSHALVQSLMSLNTNSHETYKILNPIMEEASLDKGSDGVQELSPVRVLVKRGEKHTPEEKMESNKLKRQQIIIENSVACVKQFKILKGRFLSASGRMYISSSSAAMSNIV
jgi:hypothetical protein